MAPPDHMTPKLEWSPDPRSLQFPSLARCAGGTVGTARKYLPLNGSFLWDVSHTGKAHQPTCSGLPRIRENEIVQLTGRRVGLESRVGGRAGTHVETYPGSHLAVDG